jgi:hypothetical protein
MPETDEMRHGSTRTPGGLASSPTSPRGLSVSRPWRNTSISTRRRLTLGWWIALVCVLSWAAPAAAVLLNFDNCLSKTTLESVPLQLQYVPLDVAVRFNLSDPLYPLNVTVYGNVSGTADRRSNYPSMDDPSWSNPNVTVGKIVDLSTSNNKYSTLLTSFDVLSYAAFTDPSRFCDAVTQGECPLGPVFNYNL